MATYQLTAPVGPPEDPKSGNRTADVQAVRVYLFQAFARLNKPEYNPGPGYANPWIPIVPGPADPTVKAIRAFQSRFLSSPDGRVDPNGRTWRELTSPALGAGPYFPFSRLPDASYHTGMRQFGSSRSYNKVKGQRCHAGCDLYYPQGTPIHAVEEGTVVKGPVGFYLGTDELCIYHPRMNKTIRYGEITTGSSPFREGDKVRAGDKIATVGKMTGISSTMLHLELYIGRQIPVAVYHGGKEGVITSGTNMGQTKPYYRLQSLTDPTPFVDSWRLKLVKQMDSLSAVPAVD